MKNNHKYLQFESMYDKNPKTKINGQCFQEKEIVNELSSYFNDSSVIAIETYPGVNAEKAGSIAKEFASKLNADLINIEDFAKSEQEINSMLKDFLTYDRVFGVMSHFNIEDFYQMDRIKKLKNSLPKKVVVYGFGSSLVSDKNVVYCELTRWEMQLRFRSHKPNWHVHNEGEDTLRKYKRGYFIEWRTADRLKKEVLPKSSFYIDTTDDDSWKMIRTEDLFNGLHKLAFSPFRMQPYFDPGVWGGQWMKEVCHLNPDKENYAWSFDGVPEENALLFELDEGIIATPASNLVFFEPKNLLGTRTYGRFGDEFPIRFDFLDTMGGGNLSLQVHPLTQYIQDKFGMHYTQDESYYILDAEDDATVYLGVKNGVNKEELIDSLKEAQETGNPFDAEKYVNKWPAKKHDHFLIPAGTIHCSGKNSMVLEISATPYIFTFKLYDWGRVGMDGKPRPIHIEHGSKNIQYYRDTDWVKENLINHFVEQDDGWVKTGLHEAEFIETRRKFFKEKIKVNTFGSVNMNNLVEGKAAKISSVDGSFDDYVVHYAETFIIPSTIKEYFIEPLYENEEIGIIQAYVR